MTSCVGPAEPPLSPRWVELETGCTASLRGVCAVDANLIWASGSGGLVLRSTDAGRSWQQHQAAGPESDLRDIEALSSQAAVAMEITEPARILRTDDGGQTWQVLHQSANPSSFFDSIALLGERHNPTATLVFGDPQAGQFEVLRSTDGQHFEALGPGSLPSAHAGEAAFAASGTCIATHGEQHAWIATGGTHARVLRSNDAGSTWQAQQTPIRQGEPTTGIYSIAFRDTRHGVIAGGDYTQPELGGATLALTEDGGVSWTLPERGPQGYRSAVCYLPSPNGRPATESDRGQWLLAVGRAGCDWSTDGGRSWQPFGPSGAGLGYFALSCAPDGSVYAVGAKGRAARLVWE